LNNLSKRKNKNISAIFFHMFSLSKLTSAIFFDNGLLFIFRIRQVQKHVISIRRIFLMIYSIGFIVKAFMLFSRGERALRKRFWPCLKALSVWLEQLPDENNIHIFKIEYCYIYVYSLSMLINPTDAQKSRKQINYSCFFGGETICIVKNSEGKRINR
jgi:uncharacterized membrane protein YhaH (DUF805 family)